MVAIWDYNHRNDCLVLQACAPAREDVVLHRAIAAETSPTGIAVKRNGIAFLRDVFNPGDRRHYTSTAIAKELGIKSMLSIPVFNPIHDNVGLVINLLYDDENKAAAAATTTADIKLVASDLSAYIQYLVYRRDEQIAGEIRAAAPTSKGILPLFDRIVGSLREMTHCDDVAIFRWDEKKNDLYKEAPAAVTLDTEGNPTRWLSEGADFDKRFDGRVIDVCIKQRHSFIDRITAPTQEADGQVLYVQVPYMAVPIESSTNEVVGVIRCKTPVRIDRESASFSSFDLNALESFAKAIAPSVERFLHLREGATLMTIVQDVSKALSNAYQLDTSLQNMIETLVKAMHSRFGSIYLRREGTDTFVIRAATDPMKSLIKEEAEYEVGEGITGVIASGKMLNFRTKKELRSYSHRKGKFHAAVWGEGSDKDTETLLGVPIFAGDNVIGLWKIENVQQTETHPDPYYTDEDVQVAQVISSFLEYVIQNYKQEQDRLHQFIQLAITSDRIQRAPDEDSAIKVVIANIEDAGFAGAVLSLLDNSTKEVSEKEFSGTTWSKRDARSCHISDDDIRAITLRKGKEELIADSVNDPRCRNNPTGFGLKAQYVLPLRLGDEMIGTLQVDLGASRPRRLELLTLRAFAGHLAIAISRHRSIQHSLSLTEQIMQSSRFTTAEALSGIAVHSLNHKLAQINEQLKKDLSQKEVRENRFLLNKLDEWRDNLKSLEEDLKSALRFVRAPIEESMPLSADMHVELRTAISTWIRYIHSNGCKVSTALAATRSECGMPAAAFREIMAVLLVNSVQAHSRHIEIKTYNESHVRTAGNQQIRDAFCLTCVDDGVGLPTADYEKLFEPTFTTKPKNIGTGLGLFVAQRLAQRYHGDLEVIERSHYSKGATFRLSLPVTVERKWPKKGRTN
jgi:signal transduction histidine kinase